MKLQRNAMKILPSLLALSLHLWSPLPLHSLIVTLDDNYPPYSFRDGDGNPEGILIDLWSLWSRKTGEPVTLVPQPWSLALDAMARGEADVLDTVFETPSRSLVYDFTPAYASIPVAVFQRTGVAGLVGLRDLKGYLVGVKAGDAGADVIRAAGVGVREYPSYEALIDAAGQGDVFVFCMDVPPAVHFLFSKGLSTRFRQAFVLSEDSFHRAVPKGHLATLALISHGFSLLDKNEVDAIENHWLGAPLPGASADATLTVGVALAIIALLGVLVLVLGRKIKRRTAQLIGIEAKLRSSEDWGRAVVEALPDLVVVFGDDGKILEVHSPKENPSYLQPGLLVEGRNFHDLLPQAFPPGLLDQIRSQTDHGEVAVFEQTLTVGSRPVAVEVRVVKMADRRILAIVRDVTDSRRAREDELKRNKLESLGVLAGGLAHDFNNSLAVIQGFVSLTRVQLTDPPRALASLDKAVAATRRAAGLTSQLRVLAHGSEVRRKRFSVLDLAREAASFALVGSSCLLEVEASEGPWTVEADPDQLSQVFHNLVLNAIQAMRSGGKITLVFRKSDEKISVAVVDEGSGIPSEDLPRIFDPYFTTKPKGMGLGLSVVHAVVERHGGTVEVESRVGRGTVFTVRLRASESRPEVETADLSPLPGPGGQRVLLMEDEDDLRDLMLQVTASMGLDPVACRNGREAIEAFDAATAEGRPFSLVVSDLLVPGDMGGREMISVLRSRPGLLKALAVTGFSTERSTEDFHNQGFDVIVGKPFTIDEIKTRIVELMKSPWKTASST